jgi:muramoyltetrapeptide carboxypeptidase
MRRKPTRIAIVAPGRRLDPDHRPALEQIARRHYDDAALELIFHPQCFLSDGHFAGPDEARLDAFVETANDDSIDAVWFARGGYGACRIADDALKRLTPTAKTKTYLGYSDMGYLLAALMSFGCPRVAHGPMPADIARRGGDVAFTRGLRFLMGDTQDTLEPHVGAAAANVAFNIIVLAAMQGSAYAPDLSGWVLMLEDVGEYEYRIDRALYQISRHRSFPALAGVRLGRVSDIPINDIAFGKTAEQIVQFWCARAGVAFLGGADIGHDAENKIVPFGVWRNPG